MRRWPKPQKRRDFSEIEDLGTLGRPDTDAFLAPWSRVDTASFSHNFLLNFIDSKKNPQKKHHLQGFFSFLTFHQDIFYS